MDEWMDGRTDGCKGRTKTCPFWETHSLQLKLPSMCDSDSKLIKLCQNHEWPSSLCLMDKTEHAKEAHSKDTRTTNNTNSAMFLQGSVCSCDCRHCNNSAYKCRSIINGWSQMLKTKHFICFAVMLSLLNPQGTFQLRDVNYSL